jgi:hypothetical protein
MDALQFHRLASIDEGTQEAQEHRNTGSAGSTLTHQNADTETKPNLKDKPEKDYSEGIYAPMPKSKKPAKTLIEAETCARDGPREAKR